MILSLKSCVDKNEKIPWRIIEGEAILVNVDKGEVIHLNKVAAKIWDLINGKKSVSDIIEHIYNQFEVDEKAAKRDTLEFLDELIKKGAVNY